MVHKHCVVTKRYYITRQDSQKTEGPKTEARGGFNGTDVSRNNVSIIYHKETPIDHGVDFQMFLGKVT